MDFEIPKEISDYLGVLDAFIEVEIKPLERDNIQYFDHRREHARTDWENDGQPRKEWEQLLGEMRRRADKAGHLRFALPKELGGKDGSNLAMAIIREHLASKGLGLHNDLQNESSVVGNFPTVLMMYHRGSEEQKREFLPGMLDGTRRVAFGLTEPNHGSDALYLETTAVRDGSEWVINGAKRFNSGMHHATHDMVFARTAGQPGSPKGITCFLVPCDAPGLKVEFQWWTFNMPTDHAEVSFNNVRVDDSAILGGLGDGLDMAQMFVHENRIRQAASSLGAAQYCINEAAKYAKERKTWGRPLASNQAIQWPLAEAHTDAEFIRNTIRKVAWQMDNRKDASRVDAKLSTAIAMVNYRANQLCCKSADLAIQVHGGIGYTRHKPFEHIYRHHRRYRITEGSDEVQIRKVAQSLFGRITG